MGQRKKPDSRCFQDTESMRLFVDRAQKLVDEPIWKHGGISVKLNFGSSEIVLEEPNSSLFKSYLITFRPFVLEREPIYFHKVRNVAYKHLRADRSEEQVYLRHCKQTWNDAMTRGRIIISANGTTLSPEAVLNAHLYGYFFHYDPSNVEVLNQFAKLPVRVDKIRLYDTVADLSYIIIELANFIGYGLNHDYFALHSREDS